MCAGAAMVRPLQPAAGSDRGMREGASPSTRLQTPEPLCENCPSARQKVLACRNSVVINTHNVSLIPFMKRVELETYI